MHRVTTSFLSNHAGVTLIWNLQAAGIVIGHVVAVLVAHLITLRLRYSSPDNAAEPGAAGRPDGGLYLVRALAALDRRQPVEFWPPHDKVRIRTIYKDAELARHRLNRDPRNWGRFAMTRSKTPKSSKS